MPTPLSELPIRPLTRGDLVLCADLAEDRGWAREDHKWGLLLTAGTGYGIDDPAAKGLAAVCVVTSFGPDLAAIGMMLVAGRHARQGLGRRLMAHVLREAGDTPLALYATPYGRPLYQQLGFTDSGEAERVHGQFRTPGREPLPATRPATPGDLPVLARLDAEVFGVDRTPMVARLPAFADRLRVADNGSAIIGYAAAWPTPETDVIGPLVAPDVETAKALVCSLAMDSARPVRMDVDVRHQGLLTWLKENGLEAGISTTVMTYGIPELPGDWTRRFAPLSLATG
ncbi:GNAT family N-acetyltransferase [Streptomyces sp. NPDC006923]|uniref:GNAT family N-acetyltransferase n=1 Tax=Streptomyces sp. NPDC006923 TaxID=3155355 RepID=UPI0033D780D5